MKKFYFTFGQVHKHVVGDKIFDKDCVCEIEAEDWHEARAIAFKVFDSVFCFQYSRIEDVTIMYYPRGIIKLEPTDYA